MNSKWIVSESPRSEKISEMAEKLNISKFLAAILLVRGIEHDDAYAFINKDMSCVFDPFLLQDMDKAVRRIKTAISGNETITVSGDYDADGVTSCSLLVKCLLELGGIVNYYIPERETEGYGINNNSIDIIKARGTSLIITVDCGITATNECEYAKSLGIDMIITDHHECNENLPLAVAVIDPKRKDCKYPYKYLAGVGVALKLVQALNKDICSYEETINKYAELAVIGSVADIVPLTGENRLICDIGIKKITTTKNCGIKALIEFSGLELQDIDTIKIGFIIAPRINAVGRLENATRAIELFLCDDYKKAREIANQLHEYNKQRQTIESEILEQADKQLNDSYLSDKVSVLSDKNWHHGVVGIVASRLTKKYFKPCIMISPGTEGNYKGSGRSVEGFSLYDALEYSKDTLKSFGGHELAAGLVIAEEQIEAFRKKINEYAKTHLTEEMMVPTIIADLELRGRHLTFDTYNEILKLKPFGVGNKLPVFYIKNLTVLKSYKIGNQKQHLKLTLLKDGVTIEAIAFGFGNKDIKFNSTVSVMCNLDVNDFRGVKILQLKIIDIK